jgi:hypothetical protein
MKDLQNLAGTLIMALAIVIPFLIMFFIIYMKIFGDQLEKKNSRNVSKKISKKKEYSSDGFWHGKKGLAMTFWVYFIVGNIILNAVTLIFADNQTLIILNLIFFIIWNVLSVMGVFNAADIYKAEKMKQGLPYTSATLAKVAVVLLILSGIGNSIPR